MASETKQTCTRFGIKSASTPRAQNQYESRGLSPYQRLSLKTLEFALKQVPGYASWRRFDPGPQMPLDERYAALPALSKQELRDHFPVGFIPAGRDLNRGLAAGEIEFAQTSGSTDDQVTLVFNPAWWEASERAAWRINAHARRVADGNHREVVLASPRCVGPGFSTTPLSVAARTIGRHLYVNQKINPASWSDGDIRVMAREFNDFTPLALEGDPAYLAAFAHRLTEMDITIVQPRLIFLTYSYLSRVYLHQIRRAFSAPFVSSYGSTETGHVFMECEAGRLHQNIEHCRVDFLPWQTRYGGPKRGSMRVTVFHNPWFNVLRFAIGDVARLDDRGPCPCGRDTGLTLAAIEGREKDVVFTLDGRAVTVDEIDAVMAGIPDLLGWQLDLPAPGALRLRVMAESAAAEKTRRQAQELLQGLLAAMVEVVVEKSLQHEVSGKFRFSRTAYPVDHGRLWRKAP